VNRQALDWERIVARVAVPPAADPPPPPPGLAARVLAAWQTLRRDEQVRRWGRWSLRAALAAVAGCALALAWNRQHEEPILLTPPSTPLLQPQFPAR
jgi:hypothetical protein